MNNEVKTRMVVDITHGDIRLITNRIGYSVLYKTRAIGHVRFIEQEVLLETGEKKTITRLPAFQLIDEYQGMGVEEILFDKICRREDAVPIRLLANGAIANIGLYELMGFRIELIAKNDILVMLKDKN